MSFEAYIIILHHRDILNRTHTLHKGVRFINWRYGLMLHFTPTVKGVVKVNRTQPQIMILEYWSPTTPVNGHNSLTCVCRRCGLSQVNVHPWAKIFGLFLVRVKSSNWTFCVATNIWHIQMLSVVCILCNLWISVLIRLASVGIKNEPGRESAMFT